MHDIRLITLDLDGTLLTSEKQLTEGNLAALEKAAAAGIEIVPATGRFYLGMPEVIRKLPFVHYVISVNGATIEDVVRDKTVGGSLLPYEDAVTIMEYLDAFPLIYDCYQDGWGWMTKSMYDRAADFSKSVHTLDMIRKLRTPVPDLKETLRERKRGIQKIGIFFGDMDVRAEMLERMPKDFPEFTITSSIRNNIEVNSRDATKGNALKKLADHLDLPMEKTMAFGDDLNDVTMLECAGIGVAMGNGAEAAKKAADYVTDDCDHDGVAAALAHFLK